MSDAASCIPCPSSRAERQRQAAAGSKRRQTVVVEVLAPSAGRPFRGRDQIGVNEPDLFSLRSSTPAHVLPQGKSTLTVTPYRRARRTSFLLRRLSAP